MDSKHSSENGVEKTYPQMSDDDGCLLAMLLCNGHVIPAVLHAATELNLFEIIAKATPPGLSVAEIASQLPNQYPELASRLERMLRLLASFSVLSCSTRTNENGSTERVYGISAISKYLVPDSLSSTLPLLCHKTYIESYQNYKLAIVDADSEVFKTANGAAKYEYLSKNPAYCDIFNKAQADLCIVMMNKILEKYKGFEGVSTLVDVGGGNGANLKIVLSKYPSIKGINFDRPQVTELAAPYPGIEQIGGDMFVSVPKGDAIMLKAVLHNWEDDICVEILRNCYKALPENGKVIVVEKIIPETPEATGASKLACVIDNLMLIIANGKERTVKEYENLCKRSGFSKFQVGCFAISGVAGALEFYK